MGMNEHTSKQFEAELEATCTRVLQMGGLVEAQIRAAIDGFTEGDEQLLARVVADDHRVNAYEVSIDESCAHLIARRVAIKPEVLLLDEPCSALDPISTAKVEELIHELKADYTVVIVTHNMQQAARVSDYTAYMFLGEMIEFGDTDQIFLKPRSKQTEDYITGRFG